MLNNMNKKNNLLFLLYYKKNYEVPFKQKKTSSKNGKYYSWLILIYYANN